MNDIKNINLCADDFGLSAGISRGILKLVHHQRLSAVSCMVNKPAFDEYAEQLLNYRKQVQIGLHFNLTDGPLCTGHPGFRLNTLLFKSHLGLLDRHSLTTEFILQLQSFVQTFGFLPDFIDGHQHVHQLPQVRSIILELYPKLMHESSPTLRATYPFSGGKFWFKGKILELTGGKAFVKSLTTRNIPHNPQFLGIYNFSPKNNYRDLFRFWLSQAKNEALIMCHPGERDAQWDTIAATRITELAYFSSDEFIQDCNEFNVQLKNVYSVKE